MTATVAPEPANAPDLVAVAAHELRTPLTVVAALAQMLERDVQRRMLRAAPAAQEWEAEQQQLLDKMHELCRATTRLKTLAEDLLSMRGIESGCRVPTDLRTLARMLLDEYSLLTTRHAMRLRVDDGASLVLADPSRLEQVLRNLVNNAIAYSPGGGAVEISVRCEADAVVVSVSDEGTGIPADQLDMIFTPFYRGANSTELDVQGSGLGLYLAATIVKAHHGRIWAESAPSRGSTFYIQLPRYELRQFATANSACGQPSVWSVSNGNS